MMHCGVEEGTFDCLRDCVKVLRKRAIDTETERTYYEGGSLAFISSALFWAVSRSTAPSELRLGFGK